MNILKKMATPFVAIWRWIKETAWVQPLLIVGVIFAIIFSIPSITKWVQSRDFGDDTYTWLENKQLSLEGCTNEKLSGEASDFFEAFDEAQSKWTSSKQEARASMKKYVGDSNKMFLYFVKENDQTGQINEANKLLVDELWQDKVVTAAKNKYGEENYKSYAADFKYQSIFVDQKIEVDKNDHTYDDNTAFDYLMTTKGDNVFSTIQGNWQNFPYYQNLLNGKFTSSTTIDSYSSSIKNIIDPKKYDSSIPALVVIDLTDNNKTNSIVSNVVFSFEGSNKYERADFLAHAWIGTEEFATK